jgi:1,4-dihydroxy-2-naphthoyl-CoA hydrolase
MVSKDGEKRGVTMEIGARILGNQPFPTLMGVEVLSADKNKVSARLAVRADLCTAGHIMHGGALMAFADALGAIGAFLNLARGDNTTTIESKTNFIAAAKEGTTVLGESTPVHVGKRTSIWTTRITREDGKLVAVVTQTQMVLPA